MAVHLTAGEQPSNWGQGFKSYNTLLHVTAFVLRFLSNLRAATQGQPLQKNQTLQVSEVEAAEILLFKQSQARSFPEEVGRLSAAAPLPIKQTSTLRLVHPLLSPEKLLLVGGRLSKSNVSARQKHPVILCSTDWLTKMVFVHYHSVLINCGPTLLLAHTAQSLYVRGARRLARGVCQDCLLCKRTAPKPMGQQMGQLPAARVNEASQFVHTGVDYAGPFELKSGNPRRPTITKCWLAMFVCLATKLVHIEVVSSASTEAFIAALKRFASRKGRAKHMYSDHGTNFVGARNQLKRLYDFLSLHSTDQAISDFLLTQRIQWHHIPERAPHFGGIWEAVVKQAKHHLKKVVGPVKLSFEEMATITCCIEACLNSRPYLAQGSHDAEGEVPLTPGHFLIGRPLMAYPEQAADSSSKLKSRWELCKALVQEFWNTWSTDYLRSLQKIHKWHKPLPNVKVGDLVMVLEATDLLTEWKMGKVIETFPGEDGLVRSAKVVVEHIVYPEYHNKGKKLLDPKDLKTRRSHYTRPVTKLAPLMAVSPHPI